MAQISVTHDCCSTAICREPNRKQIQVKKGAKSVKSMHCKQKTGKKKCIPAPLQRNTVSKQTALHSQRGTQEDERKVRPARLTSSHLAMCQFSLTNFLTNPVTSNVYHSSPSASDREWLCAIAVPQSSTPSFLLPSHKSRLCCVSDYSKIAACYSSTVLKCLLQDRSSITKRVHGGVR